MLKELVYAAIRYSGLPRIVRCTYARKKCSIIVYHDPPPEVFQKHIDYLSRRYRFCTLDDLARAINDRNPGSIPEKALIITLDDGDKSNFQLLKTLRNGASFTVYVCSRIVGTSRHFWWTDLGRNNINLEDMKGLSDDKILNALLATGYDVAKEYVDGRQALSAEELMEMKEFVSIQSHTRFHPILTACNNHEAEEEIAGSKADLAALGLDCNHFCYPAGAYSAREIRLVRKAGYSTARTTRFGWNDINADPYELKILGVVANDTSVNKLAAILSGFPGWVNYARQMKAMRKSRFAQLPPICDEGQRPAGKSNCAT